LASVVSIVASAPRQRGTLVPGTIPWSPVEDELVRTLPAEEVARRTGGLLALVLVVRGWSSEGPAPGKALSVALLLWREAGAGIEVLDKRKRRWDAASHEG
jgi:hypothetical protein